MDKLQNSTRDVMSLEEWRMMADLLIRERVMADSAMRRLMNQMIDSTEGAEHNPHPNH